MSINFINIYKPRNDRHTTKTSLAQLRLAAAAISANEQEKVVIDCFSCEEESLLIAQKLLSKDTEYICFTLLKWNFDIIISICILLRNLKYAGHILIGGASSKFISRKICIDLNIYTFSGEGEYFIFNLIKNNKLPNALHSELNYCSTIEYYSSYKFVELYSDYFLEHIIKSDNTIDFENILWETSRGCNFNCGYCGHKTREKSLSFPRHYVERELKNIINLNPQNLFIVDPIMGGNNDNLLFILNMLSELNPNISLTGYMHPNILNDLVVNKLSKSNISELLIGIQTLNKDVPLWIRKNNPLKIKKYLPKLSENSIPWRGELIIGLPNDSVEGLKKTLEFTIEYLRPTWLRVYPLLLIEGSPMYGYYLNNSSKIGFDTNGIVAFTDYIDTYNLKFLKAYAGAISSLYCFYKEKDQLHINYLQIEQICLNILKEDKYIELFSLLDKKKMRTIWDEAKM